MSARIHYFCPSCKTTLDSPIADAGRKTNCPTCGQRLQIPLPDRKKTVLAPCLGVEQEETTTGPPPLPPLASPAPPLDAQQDPGSQYETPKVSVPASVMVAAALLFGYGGLMLFCSCSEFAIAATSANRQANNPNFDQFGRVQPELDRKLLALGITWAAVKCFTSGVLLLSALAVFRAMSIGRWLAVGALAGDFLAMLVGTAAFFIIANANAGQGPLQAEGFLALGLLGRFVPYMFWLAFVVPIGILLYTPSANKAFA